MDFDSIKSERVILMRTDGSTAGALLPDDNDQYGFVVGGFDSENNLTNYGIFGSNIYFGYQNQYIGSNTAVPYGYLKLGGVPVLDEQGNEFYPLGFQQIEEELYREEFTNSTQYNISNGAETTILASTALVNGYTPPATFEWEFRLEETSNRSTQIEYWIELDGVETGRRTTTVSSNTIVTISGFVEVENGANAGQIVSLHVQALDTGGGRNTIIRGDDNDTKIILRKLGFGVYKDSAVEVVPNQVGVTIQSTNSGAVIFLDATSGDIAETLGEAANYFNKTFTFKRLDNSSNTVSLSPSVGDNIDQTDSNGAVALFGQDDAITMYSDGNNWEIISSYKTNGADVVSITGDYTLPDAGSFIGVLRVVNRSGSEWVITANGSDTIEDSASQTIQDGDTYDLISINNNWVI